MKENEWGIRQKKNQTKKKYNDKYRTQVCAMVFM